MARGKFTGGRKPGTPNKLTVAFKSAVLTTYDAIGGDVAFAAWAKKNPTEYYKIAARLIPHEIVGPAGGPHLIKQVVHVHEMVQEDVQQLR